MSKANRLLPGAKKSCSEGSFSGGAGVIEMGAVVDKVGSRIGVLAAHFL